jgi:hypothetical protein
MSAQRRPPRRSRKSLAMVLAACLAVGAALVLAVGSSGSAAPQGPPTVALSLTAPTSGATVGVRVIRVAGTVSPAQAVVRVGRRRVRVRHGRFSTGLVLDRSTTRIRVTAVAAGYVPARTASVVHYSSGTAYGMLIAQRASTAAGSLPTLSGDGWLSMAVPLASSAGRQHFMTSCEGGDSSGAPVCTCLYNRFVASGQFSTRAQMQALDRQAIKAAADQNSSEVPLVFRTGLASCARQLFMVPGTGASG